MEEGAQGSHRRTLPQLGVRAEEGALVQWTAEQIHCSSSSKCWRENTSRQPWLGRLLASSDVPNTREGSSSQRRVPESARSQSGYLRPDGAFSFTVNTLPLTSQRHKRDGELWACWLQDGATGMTCLLLDPAVHGCGSYTDG